MSRTSSRLLPLALCSFALALLPGQVSAQKRQRDLITREEIEASPKRADFIYDVIRSLRPHFLDAPRGTRSVSVGTGTQPTRRSGSESGSIRAEAAVFMDGNHAGGIDILKTILAEMVSEVRYYAPDEAQAEFGVTLGAGGAIVLKMNKPAKPPGPAGA